MSTGEPYNYIATITTPNSYPVDTSTSISFLGGVFRSSNGNLNWDDNDIAGTRYSFSRISVLLKDSLYKDICLCKTEEECKELYGNKGLEIYKSLLNEILQESIKAEEEFNKVLQLEQEKVRKLKAYILKSCLSDEDKQAKCLELLKVAGV